MTDYTIRDECARFIAIQFRRVVTDLYRSSNNNPGLSFRESLEWAKSSEDLRFDWVIDRLRESIDEDLFDERTRRFLDEKWLLSFFRASEDFQEMVIRHSGL